MPGEMRKPAEADAVLGPEPTDRRTARLKRERELIDEALADIREAASYPPTNLMLGSIGSTETSRCRYPKAPNRRGVSRPASGSRRCDTIGCDLPGCGAGSGLDPALAPAARLRREGGCSLAKHSALAA